MTQTEEYLKSRKRSDTSGTLLVPLIEQFMKNPVEVEDEEDFDYLLKLISARSRPRVKGVYSPSMLASCLRQTYFSKIGQKRYRAPKIETSSYFLNGNFLHYKWQFVLWKMHRAGVVELTGQRNKEDPLGAEIFVSNNAGDHGGSIDNCVYVGNELVTVDWKSANAFSFGTSVTRNTPGIRYITQSCDYALLANEDESLRIPKIKKVLIIFERKDGPINSRAVSSPLGLFEWAYDPNEYRPVIARRIKKLRAYESKKLIPPVECGSTKIMQYKGCPFAPYCKGEVEAYEREHKKQTKDRKVKFNRRRNGQEGSSKK